MKLFGTVVCSCSTACFSSPCLHDYLPETLLPDTPQQGQKFPLVPRKWLKFFFCFFLQSRCWTSSRPEGAWRLQVAVRE